ncbi:NAD(P)H-binding protein [Maribacter sp. 2-571]|uniref:NAD(P)H-binding protein n=1 Tax=Maribacter sp. 2-571 TaxID=3417569 RepID=UPI003D33DAF6
MKTNEKIAVIGGTGKSGSYLVRQLQKQKYHFRLLVRNPERFVPELESTSVVVGDVSDVNTVRTLLRGCTTVLSCLGSGIPASKPTIFSTATATVLRCMSELDIQRYIVLTGLNVDTPKDKKGVATKFSTDWMYENYPISTKDRQREYELLVNSTIDWTLLRLPLITLTDKTTTTESSLIDCGFPEISAASLVRFMLEQLKSDLYIKQAPFVFDKPI